MKEQRKKRKNDRDGQRQIIKPKNRQTERGKERNRKAGKKFLYSFIDL